MYIRTYVRTYIYLKYFYGIWIPSYKHIQITRLSLLVSYHFLPEMLWTGSIILFIDKISLHDLIHIACIIHQVAGKSTVDIEFSIHKSIHLYHTLAIISPLWIIDETSSMHYKIIPEKFIIWGILELT